MFDIEILLRLLLAVLLGSAIGVERTRAGKTAGLRTFALVSLGACLFISMSVYLTDMYGNWSDPSRVLASIVTGIGFLGAGMIVLSKDGLKNLTTAASIWLTAGVGAAIGFGFYFEAFVTTILVIIIFTVFWWLEEYIRQHLLLEPKPAGKTKKKARKKSQPKQTAKRATKKTKK
jgi:putative Mg2+ transporter-C (MgtC) family protein